MDDGIPVWEPAQMLVSQIFRPGMHDWGIKLDILAMPLTDLKYIHV